MGTAAVPYGRSTQKAPAVKEVHILWITAGLGCDGDSVSITAATQPSIEDVLLGAIPGLPKVHLHNPVLAYECGDDFMKHFYLAEEGNWSRSCSWSRVRSQTKISRKKDIGRAGNGYGRRNSRSRRRVDRPFDAEGAGGGGHWNLCDLRRHSRHGRQSHRLHGPRRLPGMGLAIEGGLPDRECSGMPGPARQLHGDGALPALSGCRPGTDDSAWTTSFVPRGSSATPYMTDATAPAITSRAISPNVRFSRNAS
jgi:hypothetical protein